MKEDNALKDYINPDGTVNSKKLEEMFAKAVSEVNEEKSDEVFEEISEIESLLIKLNHMHIAESNLLLKNGSYFIEDVKNALASKNYAFLKEYKNKLWLESLEFLKSISSQEEREKLEKSIASYTQLFYFKTKSI